MLNVCKPKKRKELVEILLNQKNMLCLVRLVTAGIKFVADGSNCVRWPKSLLQPMTDCSHSPTINLRTVQLYNSQVFS